MSYFTPHLVILQLIPNSADSEAVRTFCRELKDLKKNTQLILPPDLARISFMRDMLFDAVGKCWAKEDLILYLT